MNLSFKFKNYQINMKNAWLIRSFKEYKLILRQNLYKNDDTDYM